MNVHRLDYSLHKRFLAEGRRDPFSKQRLSAGDEIVFCGQCKIAQLVASWESAGNCCAACGHSEILGGPFPEGQTTRARFSESNRLPPPSPSKGIPPPYWKPRWLGVAGAGALATAIAVLWLVGKEKSPPPYPPVPPQILAPSPKPGYTGQEIRSLAEEAVRLAQELGLATLEMGRVRKRLELSEHLTQEVSSRYQQDVEEDRDALNRLQGRHQTLAEKYAEVLHRLCGYTQADVQVAVGTARVGLIQTGSETARQLVKAHVAGCAERNQAKWIREIEAAFRAAAQN